MSECRATPLGVGTEHWLGTTAWAHRTVLPGESVELAKCCGTCYLNQACVTSI